MTYAKSPLTYSTDIIRDELDQIAPPASPLSGGRMVVYNSKNGKDYIYFGMNKGNITMTVFGDCWNFGSALTYLQKEVKRHFAMELVDENVKK